MKYQSLVSSTTPSDLQEWLGQELEDRGIDSVYARSILSLLQQDCVDFDPWECQHLRNRQLKYGGPENLYSATKTKHQKWKTWSKHILLSSHSCCKAVFFDLERVKKQAAVDCLRSASDYVNDIEELIDKVCIKLKNFKNLMSDRDEVHLKNVHDKKIIDPFFTPPSSPTDDIKKYFDAFPPLNDNIDKTTDIYQHNIIKNAWCGVCVMKTNSKSHISNQCYQPVIPYKPSNQIKNICHEVEHTVLLNYNDKQTFSPAYANVDYPINKASHFQQITNSEQIKLAKLVINCAKGSWKAMSSIITKAISFPLENLLLLKINMAFFPKIPLIHEVKTFTLYYNILACMESDFFLKTLSECNFFICDINTFSNLEKAEEECNNLICLRKMCFEEFFSTSSVQEILAFNKTEYCNYLQVDRDFNVSSVSDNKEIRNPFLEHNSNIYSNSNALKNSIFNKNKFEFKCQYSNAKILEKENFIKVYNKNGDINKKELSGNAYKFDTLSKEENVCNSPDIQFCGSFATASECDFKIFPSTNEMFSIVDDKKKFHSSDEYKNLLISSKLSFWTSNTGYSLTNCSFERNSVDDKDDLKLEVDRGKQSELDKCVVNCNQYVGQKLLKNVLFINKICFPNSHHDEGNSATLFQKFATWTPPNNIDLPNISIGSMEQELEKYQFRLDLDKYSEHVQLNKSTAIASNCSHFKTYDEMWLLYWGDNHNFIAHTWQKDRAVFEKHEDVELLHKSEVIAALSKEIKEDGDELLRRIYSMPGISDDTAITFSQEMPISAKGDIYPDLEFGTQASNHFSYDEEIFLHQVSNSPDFNYQNDANLCTSYIDTSFTINDLKGDHHPEMLQDCESHNPLFCYNDSLEGPNYTDLSAFSNSYENTDSIERDFYVEGGGWSFASDSFLDYTSFVNPYEKSCSLDNLDLGNTETGFSEFLYQKRIRCTSETDEHIKQYLKKQNQTSFQKHLKQKIASRKRPCCFFLQGSCFRSDCKYSHDLSTTTCRFWKEGSCFKGTTCPFLHGYNKDTDKNLCMLENLLRNHSTDHSYSLESETDFPSLSSAQNEPSKVKSAPIDIIQVKERKKY